VRDRSLFLEALAEAGRRPEDVAVLVDLELDRHRPAADQAVVADLPGESARWADAGASELVIGYVRPEQLEAVIAARERLEVG